LTEGYLDELRVVRRLAPNTLDSYSRDLQALHRYAETHEKRIDKLSREDL